MQFLNHKNIFSSKLYSFAVYFLFFAVFLFISGPKNVYADLPTSGTNCNRQNYRTCLKSNPIVQDLNLIVNILSVGVGVIVAMMVLVGAVQYISAGDSPAKVEAAKKRISNAIFALLIFLFMFAFLNWLVPGGVID